MLSLIEQQGLTLTDYTAEDAQEIEKLPELAWKDPFDMAIMAQAVHNAVPLLTSDTNILTAQVPGLIDIDARK